MGVPPQPHDPFQTQPGRQKRGMTKTGHGFNWTLTIFTCGMWLPFYWGWWATVRCVQAWRNHRRRKRQDQMYG